MAIQMVERLVDDIDGSDAERTVRFAYEGVAYEIELSTAHVVDFERAIAPFMQTARSAPDSASRGNGAKAHPGRLAHVDQAAVRAWASVNGHDVSPRGRIPNAVVDAYRADQAGQPSTARATKATATRRKASVRKTSARKSPVKKAAPRKAAPRKTAAKKAAAATTTPETSAPPA